MFTALVRGGWIDDTLANQLVRMVGFRDIAVHDDQTLQLPITVRTITDHPHQFLQCNRDVLLHDAALRPPAAPDNQP